MVNRLTKTEGKSREVLSGSLIPKQISTMLKDSGVTNPVLEFGYNSHAGSVVAGIKVKDGKKTVSAIAVGLDKTRGSAPILQLRGKTFNGSEEIAGVQFLMNPNAAMDSSGNVLQAMAKRNGVYSIQSEIGNAHIMNFRVNPEGMRQSAVAKLFPESAIDETDLRKVFEEIQKSGFQDDLKLAGQKLTDFVAGSLKSSGGTVSPQISKAEELKEFAKSAVIKGRKLFKGVYLPLEKSKNISSIEAINAAKVSADKKLKPLKVINIPGAKRQTPVSFVGQPVVHYGKHKVKRYLYHLTSEENYKKILESGKLHISNNDRQLDYGGVFMTDLANLTKRWRASGDWDINPDNPDGVYLSLALLFQAVKNGHKIVCLRVPTKNLNHDLLKIRSQNKLAKCEITQENRYAEHVKKGAPAKDSSLYKKRKEAIEYIYQEDIPLDKTELVGEIDISHISIDTALSWSKHQQKDEVKAVLRRIFSGQPEQKAIDAMV